VQQREVLDAMGQSVGQGHDDGENHRVAPTTAVPMSTGFADALNVLPAPSLASSRCFARSNLTSMPKSFFNSASMPGTVSISDSS